MKFKRTVVLLVMLLQGMAIARISASKIIEVTPNVVMLQNEKTNGCNITCIALDGGLIFIDCSLFTEIAASFRKDMEKRFEKNTLLLVLSHAHVDHFFGMGAFKDVPVYMAHEGRRYFEYQLSIDFNAQVEAYSRIFPCFADAVKTADLFMPTKFFEGDLVLGHGRSIAVVRCTGGHSVGSSYVYVESEECIVAGDNVQVDYYPYFGDRSGNMNSWISALVAWELLEVKHICPGHGPTVDKEYMTTTRHFFQNLVSALKKLKIENTDIKQVIAHASLPKGYWPDELEKPLWYDPAVAQLYRSME